MACIDLVRHPEICSICRSSTEQYLRYLTNRTSLQIEALACILDKKTTPIQRQPVPVPAPRGRAAQADFVIQFVQNSDQTFNNWYATNIRENMYDIHYINGIMRTYHFLITSLFKCRTFPSAQRAMDNVLNA